MRCALRQRRAARRAAMDCDGTQSTAEAAHGCRESCREKVKQRTPSRTLEQAGSAASTGDSSRRGSTACACMSGSWSGVKQAPSATLRTEKAAAAAPTSRLRHPARSRRTAPPPRGCPTSGTARVAWQSARRRTALRAAHEASSYSTALLRVRAPPSRNSCTAARRGAHTQGLHRRCRLARSTKSGAQRRQLSCHAAPTTCASRPACRPRARVRDCSPSRMLSVACRGRCMRAAAQREPRRVLESPAGAAQAPATCQRRRVARWHVQAACNNQRRAGGRHSGREGARCGCARCAASPRPSSVATSCRLTRADAHLTKRATAASTPVDDV